MRDAGLAARRRLDAPLTCSGALWWEESGDAFEAQHQALARLGYDVDVIDAVTFAKLEPHVAPPSQALRFVAEGVAEPMATTQTLLHGARRISGVAVWGISTRAGRITGVEPLRVISQPTGSLLRQATQSGCVDASGLGLARAGSFGRDHAHGFRTASTGPYLGYAGRRGPSGPCRAHLDTNGGVASKR